MHPSLREMVKHGLNPYQCAAFLTATGTFADRLREAFPEFYSEDMNDLCFPVSIIREAAKYKDPGNWEALRQEETELDWKDAVKHYGIPIAYEWCNGLGGMGGDDRIPDVVWNQIKGIRLCGGMTVIYKKKWYTAVWIGSIALKNPVKVGKTLESSEGIALAVVHSEHIDLIK
jgi:hypothetical protein